MPGVYAAHARAVTPSREVERAMSNNVAVTVRKRAERGRGTQDAGQSNPEFRVPSSVSSFLVPRPFLVQLSHARTDPLQRHPHFRWIVAERDADMVLGAEELARCDENARCFSDVLGQVV